jgi:hypothetical protein
MNLSGSNRRRPYCKDDILWEKFLITVLEMILTEAEDTEIRKLNV